MKNWDQFIELKKPGNWKEETWLAKLPELQAEAAVTAGDHPLAGQIKRWVIYQLQPGVRGIVTEEQFDRIDEGTCGGTLISLVEGLLEKNLYSRFFGKDITLRMRQACWDYFAATKQSCCNLLWLNRRFVNPQKEILFDPTSMLCTDGVTVPALLNRIGGLQMLSKHKPFSSNPDPEDSAAVTEAKLMADLVLFFGLYRE